MRTVTISCRSIKDMCNKVSAIKGVRTLSHLGLREAKDLVERVNPGHNEVINLVHDILEPDYSIGIQQIRASGLAVHASTPNDKVRLGIGDQIRSLVTFATMAGQYDIAKSLLDVMETYCPEPAEEYRNADSEEEKDT